MQPAIFRNQLLAKLSAKQAAEKNKQTNQNNKTDCPSWTILTNLLKMRVGQHPGKVATVSSLFGFTTKNMH